MSILCSSAAPLQETTAIMIKGINNNRQIFDTQDIFSLKWVMPNHLVMKNSGNGFILKKKGKWATKQRKTNLHTQTQMFKRKRIQIKLEETALWLAEAYIMSNLYTA